MYAPLDFRLVIGPEPTLTNLQQNKAATDRHGFPPGSKNQSVLMRDHSWSKVAHWVAQNGLKIVLLCVFRPEFRLTPSTDRMRN